MAGAADPYLATVQARLAADGFAWEEAVPWEGSVFSAVAKRSRFAPSRFGVEDRWFLLGEYPEVDQVSLAGYSTACFNYAAKHKLNPLPRGLFRAVTCFGVVLAGTVDPAVAEAIHTQQPDKHWSAIVFPAVYDRSTGALHVYEKTPMWGAAYWGGLRKAAQRALAPAAAAAPAPPPAAPPPPPPPAT